MAHNKDWPVMTSIYMEGYIMLNAGILASSTNSDPKIFKRRGGKETSRLAVKVGCETNDKRWIYMFNQELYQSLKPRLVRI